MNKLSSIIGYVCSIIHMYSIVLSHLCTYVHTYVCMKTCTYLCTVNYILTYIRLLSFSNVIVCCMASFSVH